MKQNKPVYIITILTLAAVIFGLAWAEQLTLTTYYPAPYGVYREFTTTSKTILATELSANVGIGIDTPAEKLDVEGKIHATEDVCIDGPICLSGLSGGAGGWQYSGDQIKFAETPPGSWQAINLPNSVGTNYALVVLKARYAGTATAGKAEFAVRPGGDPDLSSPSGPRPSGTAELEVNHNIGNDNGAGVVVIETNASGVIEWKKTGTNNSPSVDIWLLGFIK